MSGPFFTVQQDPATRSASLPSSEQAPVSRRVKYCARNAPLFYPAQFIGLEDATTLTVPLWTDARPGRPLSAVELQMAHRAPLPSRRARQGRLRPGSARRGFVAGQGRN